MTHATPRRPPRKRPVPLSVSGPADPAEFARGLASMLASIGLSTLGVTTVLDKDTREPYAWRFTVLTFGGVWEVEVTERERPAEGGEDGGQT